MSKKSDTFEGGCTCGQVRYKMVSKPLIVHGCHCSWCQRQTGTVFAQNALIEADRVEVLSGKIENTVVASPSGDGQQIARCPKCKVALWSNYLINGFSDLLSFIRVGTLDEPGLLPPDIHIFTSSKQPWVVIPSDHKRVDEYYDTDEIWSKDSLKRLDDLSDKAKKLGLGNS